MSGRHEWVLIVGLEVPDDRLPEIGAALVRARRGEIAAVLEVGGEVAVPPHVMCAACEVLFEGGVPGSCPGRPVAYRADGAPIYA